MSPKLYLTDTFTIGGEAMYKFTKEWLLWDSDTEQLSTFETDRYEADFRLDWYPSTRQEVRLKFQWIAIDAESITGFELGSNGEINPSTTEVSDFAISDTALQLRYRYQLAPLSDIFLVYSRGGYFSSDESDHEPINLFTDSLGDKSAETVIAKVRYRF